MDKEDFLEEIRKAKEHLKDQKDKGDIPHINIGDTEEETKATIDEYPNLDGMQNVQIPDDWDGDPLPQMSLNDFKKETKPEDIEKVSLPYREDKVTVSLTPEELIIIKNVLLRSMIDYEPDRYFSEMNINAFDEVMTYHHLAMDLKKVLEEYYKRKGYDPLLESWKKKAVSKYEV